MRRELTIRRRHVSSARPFFGRTAAGLGLVVAVAAESSALVVIAVATARAQEETARRVGSVGNPHETTVAEQKARPSAVGRRPPGAVELTSFRKKPEAALAFMSEY